MLLTVALFAGIFSVWAVILQFQFRHIGLTALALFAPFPLLCVACLLWARSESYAGFSYVFGIIVAQITAARIARGICEGLMPRAAVLQALRYSLKVAGFMAIGSAAWMLATDMAAPSLENVAAAITLFVAFFGALAVMNAAAWFSYPEQFIARANQARELRERWMEHWLFITETRWSLSITGVALIFAALSAFGTRPLHVQADPWLAERLAGLAIFVFAGAISITRDWRLGMALTLTLALLAALGFWAYARGAVPMMRGDLLILSILLATAAVPLAMLASSVSAYLRGGDDAASALSRGLQDEGADAVIAAVLSIIPWCVVALAGGAMRFPLAISIASLFAALLIFPAIAHTLYTLLPRYRTVDEVFGRR
jgi:hypothetical protein